MDSIPPDLPQDKPRKGPTPKSLEARLWTKIDVRGPDECWLWRHAKDSKGYGHIYISNERKEQAHRVVYRLVCGEIPPGMCVCHRCDTPACCNPDHLFLGTILDNMMDKIAKGRQGQTGARGEKNGSAKLKEEDVRSIRKLYADGETKMGIAARFGVDSRVVFDIVNGKKWTHVSDLPPE